MEIEVTINWKWCKCLFFYFCHTACCFFSMLPLLIKDQLVPAFVALVIIFYLVADLCLLEAASNSPVSVNSTSLSSQTSKPQFNVSKTLPLMVCNTVHCTNRLWFIENVYQFIFSTTDMSDVSNFYTILTVKKLTACNNVIMKCSTSP